MVKKQPVCAHGFNAKISFEKYASGSKILAEGLECFYILLEKLFLDLIMHGLNRQNFKDNLKTMMYPSPPD